jgi:hypothetical protein
VLGLARRLHWFESADEMLELPKPFPIKWTLEDESATISSGPNALAAVAILLAAQLVQGIFRKVASDSYCHHVVVRYSRVLTRGHAQRRLEFQITVNDNVHVSRDC